MKHLKKAERHQSKHCEYDKDEVNSQNILSDKNHQASSQKFRQIIGDYYPYQSLVFVNFNFYPECYLGLKDQKVYNIIIDQNIYVKHYSMSMLKLRI